METKNIKKFIELIQDTDIVELNWEKDGVKIGFKRGSAPELSNLKTKESELWNKKAALSPEAIASDEKIELRKEEKKPIDDKLRTIKAPIVGTFYRAPTADASFFVQEGSIIKKGQKICVIEAMRVMKEINATVSGKIVKILVDNGSHVEYGQDIFLVDTKVKKA